ncbi:hypothetical protein PR048_008633 [Dryococelus australis]|uniref:Reverse transcriptase/retrotransposon-derived protein RNase H-like domain-containing protein n=1 Tax=Dryococelus australis TaxID=614101 RepID=A0ABQ9HXP0_9NEOP|nr:hypothetical protein PR048_008633 [Dryococelus australis]
MNPNPDEVNALLDMQAPVNKKELQTLMGVVTYIDKFAPFLSQSTKSLRSLLKNKVVFEWGENQIRELENSKQNMSRAPILQFYDVEKPVVVSVDSSSKALGAVLLQGGFPVAYASKSLTENQKNWAQI